jgi:hypothetical protein
MSKKFFWGKKYILTSGREVDLNADEEAGGTIALLAFLNQLDAIHEITKPLSVRLEWKKGSKDPIVSFECRGGAPGDKRPISESELPVEGLNGSTDKLLLSEILELVEVMKSFYNKLEKEVKERV